MKYLLTPNPPKKKKKKKKNKENNYIKAALNEMPLEEMDSKC